MTSPVTLDETVTYWLPVVDTDGAGGKSFAAGVAVPGRHADTREEVFTEDGKVRISKKIFYLEVALNMGAYIAFGDFSAAVKPDKTANMIIGRKSIPSMFGTLTRVAV